MKINVMAVAAICCKAWGVKPRDFAEMRKRGEVSVQEVVAQCRLEMVHAGFACEALFEWLMPGSKEAERKKKHVATNTQTLIAWKKLKERQQNGR